MATDDLDRLLADIDDLLPPGAPCDAHDPELSDDAMRWSPTDHDDHPDTAPPDRHVRRYADLPPEHPMHHRPHAISNAARARLYGTAPNTMPTWVREALDNTDPAAYRSPADRIAAAIARLPIGWHTLSVWYGDVIIAYIDGVELAEQHHRHGATPRDTAQALIEARRHRNTGPSNPHGIDGRPRRTRRQRRAAAPHARPATQEHATPPRGPTADAVWADEAAGWLPIVLPVVTVVPGWASVVSAAAEAERAAVIHRATMQDGAAGGG